MGVGGVGGCSQRKDAHTHTNTPRQSQISRKGLGIDWLDSRAAITYESGGQIRTVARLMAPLGLPRRRRSPMSANDTLPSSVALQV